MTDKAAIVTAMTAVQFISAQLCLYYLIYFQIFGIVTDMSDYDYEYESDISIHHHRTHRLSDSSDFEYEPMRERGSVDDRGYEPMEERGSVDDRGYVEDRDGGSGGDDISDRGQVEGETGNGQDTVFPTLQCQRHPPGSMLECCNDCERALSLLKPEVVKQMLAPAAQSVSSRYAARSDDKDHSMEFSSATLEVLFRMDLVEWSVPALPLSKDSPFRTRSGGRGWPR